MGKTENNELYSIVMGTKGRKAAQTRVWLDTAEHLESSTYTQIPMNGKREARIALRHYFECSNGAGHGIRST